MQIKDVINHLESLSPLQYAEGFDNVGLLTGQVDWEVKGMEVFPNAEVVIFNRFGKPIYTLNATNPKWNGTYSDTPLPASDYWFSLKLDPSIPEIRGHFTLKR